MAIKIKGTTVINDSADIVNIADVTASGTITLNSLVYPSTDGSAGQFIKTDGSGNLSFDSAGGISTGKAIAMAILFS
jgi:hypothetical protein